MWLSQPPESPAAGSWEQAAEVAAEGKISAIRRCALHPGCFTAGVP
ncbi:hypothetical protein HED96_004113 [Salmonella enterica]|nr:hypothetical protein [Salmonella enterica]EIO8746600.1 hypothetical protein [Salmonella enterica]